MYKHNKEILFIEREEMSKHSFFDQYFSDTKVGNLPPDVVSIKKADAMNIPTKYMIQLGGVKSLRSKTIYLVEFKCKKARDSHF